MKVWTKTLGVADLAAACISVNRDFPGCALLLGDAANMIDGPRVRRRRIENVYLYTEVQGHHAMGIHWRNTGKFGAHQYEQSASWTEHGWWMARVFAMDPDARMRAGVVYEHAEHFHEVTDGRFDDPRTPRERQVRGALRMVG